MQNLEKFFHPSSIALIGVSRNMTGLGGTSFLNRLQEAGFSGRLYPINSEADEILDLKAYPDLSSLPEVPDLAIVCVAAAQVPAALEECARVGVLHVHILTAGFREIGTREGDALDDRIAAIAADTGLLIMGPNCMGPYCPSSRLTAWGAIPGLHGPLGIISQSGMVAQRLTEYGFSLGIGVNKAASIGNATVLDIHDVLEYMASDEGIRVIAMYLEGVRDGRRLLRIIKAVNLRKPVILLKGGESESGASTVASHTGRLAGVRKVWEAFIRQTGVVHVRSINELMDVVLSFCYLPEPRGNGVFLIGGGGGNSVLHGDTCVRKGLSVPTLSQSSMERLRPMVPVVGSIASNPLDFWKPFYDPACLGDILEIGFEDPGIHAIIVDRLINRIAYHAPDLPDRTEETIDTVSSYRHRKPIIFVVDSEGGDTDLALKGTALRARCCNAGIPAYPSMERASRALARLWHYYARFGTGDLRGTP